MVSLNCFTTVTGQFYHGKRKIASVTALYRGEFITVNVHGYVKKIERETNGRGLSIRVLKSQGKIANQNARLTSNSTRSDQ